MLLTRERPRTSARALMPAPAPLPSLSDALARRAAIFGPFDGEKPPAALCGRQGTRQAQSPRVRKALLSSSDTLDIPGVSVRPPFGGYHETISIHPRADVSDSMMVFAEDVPGAVADVAAPLAFEQNRQKPVTPTRQLRANHGMIGQLRVAGGLRHALAVVLNHGHRLLGTVSLADMALRAGSHQPHHHNKLKNLGSVTFSVDADNL